MRKTIKNFFGFLDEQAKKAKRHDDLMDWFKSLPLEEKERLKRWYRGKS